jgi:peptide subunit release factor RF-3
MRIKLTDEYGAFLTRAQPATELCARVLEQVADEPVVLDFSGVVQMSPSFANALFFNLLHRLSLEELRRRVQIENAVPYILDAVNSAIARKVEHRAELTAYM